VARANQLPIDSRGYMHGSQCKRNPNSNPIFIYSWGNLSVKINPCLTS